MNKKRRITGSPLALFSQEETLVCTADGCFSQDPDTPIDDVIQPCDLPFVRWTRCAACGCVCHEECKKIGQSCDRCVRGTIAEWYD